jgi:O-methyltransferase
MLYSWQDDIVFKEKVLTYTKGITLVGPERLYILYQLVKQVSTLDDCFAEVGVYKGGTAKMIFEASKMINRRFRRFFLCDTFEGMPETDTQKDKHHKGDFADTSLEGVRKLFNDGEVELYKGVFPDSIPLASYCFGARYSLVHIDCDIYKSVKDCCEFFYKRMSVGGVMVFDDYGFPSCPGALLAVNEFFLDRPEQPIVLPTGQCLVFKL